MINQAGIDLIKEFEGFRASTYRDSVGVLTIGYGTTAAAGVGITPAIGMTITQAQAEAYLKAAVDKFAAQIKADRVNNFKPTPLQPTQNVVQPGQPAQNAQVTDPNLLAWQERNDWFGKNRKMTAYALGVHEDIVGDGVPVGSNEYYKRLDADLQERFPDVVKADAGDAPTRRAGNVVAPATRSTAPKKIVLTQTQVSLAKRLGVPLELYARKAAETMRK